MVIEVTLCPICNRGDDVVKHGTTKSGSPRRRCLVCKKTFTPKPKSRKIDQKTEEAIARAIEERMAWNAIKRTFRVAWSTIFAIAQKKQTSLPPF